MKEDEEQQFSLRFCFSLVKRGVFGRASQGGGTGIYSRFRVDAAHFSLEGGQRVKVLLLFSSSSKMVFAPCQIFMTKL